MARGGHLAGTGKHKTTDYRQLNISKLAKGDLLKSGLQYGWEWKRRGRVVAAITISTEQDRIKLDYQTSTDGQNKQDHSYYIGLNFTPCHMGGQRTWFICPSCQKRAAILYGKRVFACRKCCELVYPITTESKLDRKTRKLDKLRERLQWQAGFLNGYEWKPKGMHWRTYRKLERTYRLTECQTYLEMNKTMPLFGIEHVRSLQSEIAELERG